MSSPSLWQKEEFALQNIPTYLGLINSGEKYNTFLNNNKKIAVRCSTVRSKQLGSKDNHSKTPKLMSNSCLMAHNNLVSGKPSKWRVVLHE